MATDFPPQVQTMLLLAASIHEWLAGHAASLASCLPNHDMVQSPGESLCSVQLGLFELNTERQFTGMK
jgi:hypothetical protein